MNLFLTKDGVLKLGYYGLTTQAECYSIRKTDCEGVRSFGPEVFKGKYEMKSDVWSLGIALIEMMGMTPYDGCGKNDLPTVRRISDLPFDIGVIRSSDLIYFLQNCFEMKKSERRSVKELMNVSVMR